MIEVNEVIFRWHRGDAFAAIARSLGTDRKTVRKYVNMAKQLGLNQGSPLPPDHELAALLAPLRRALAKAPATPGRDRLKHHHDRLAEWANDGRVTIKQMWRLLKEQQPDLAISYNCLKAYVQSNFRPVEQAATIRLIIPAGLQAQVDFGYVGLMHDPVTAKMRKSWAFIMTLSHSRYRFVRFVFNQDVQTWVDCHIRAFEFFGAVPKTIILDNLKAGVIKPDLYDPTLNRLYRDLERHYGFAADPAKVATPQHKGRVERSVSLVRNQLLAGRDFANIEAANAFALLWCRDMNGLTTHATTQQRPREVFETEDRPAMLPLPELPFENASWHKATVHHDHHIVVRGAYYSVPTRYIGKSVWVRASERFIRIFLDEQLIKTHIPAKSGEFQTDSADYPEAARHFLKNTATVCREKARFIGPATMEVIDQALAPHTVQGLRKAHAILRMAEDHGHANVEGACRRGLHFGHTRVNALRDIVKKGLAHAPLEPMNVEAPQTPVQGFTRPAHYFSHTVEAVCSTN
jgi:transposase